MTAFVKAFEGSYPDDEMNSVLSVPKLEWNSVYGMSRIAVSRWVMKPYGAVMWSIGPVEESTGVEIEIGYWWQDRWMNTGIGVDTDWSIQWMSLPERVDVSTRMLLTTTLCTEVSRSRWLAIRGGFRDVEATELQVSDSDETFERYPTEGLFKAFLVGAIVPPLRRVQLTDASGRSRSSFELRSPGLRIEYTNESEANRDE